MALRKQEFYEGAALHRLLRAGSVDTIRYDPPFFRINSNLFVYLKYSTKGRSPWAFTLTASEQATLHAKASEQRVVLGLVCGGDGVATLSFENLIHIAARRECAVHLACYRRHNEHYEITGPDGAMAGKIAPSDWLRILEK